jgi:hypothetical protein
MLLPVSMAPRTALRRALREIIKPHAFVLGKGPRQESEGPSWVIHVLFEQPKTGPKVTPPSPLCENAGTLANRLSQLFGLKT